jgi:alkylated DNA repair dioxygenase AlkB
MTIALQPSLFDVADAPPAFNDLLHRVRRTPLSRGAWVDHLPGWLSGSDQLFAELVDEVPWRAERRQMYDRVVDVPRLLSFYGEADPLPHPLLADARRHLDDHYAGELGERFRTAGLCYYRDGRDSVAWHGDRIGRGRNEDTMVAILSLGEARKLMLRPNGGGSGKTLTFSLGHGDLLVMGGSCQRTWEHCVPKSTRPCGPRISVQYRPRAVL